MTVSPMAIEEPALSEPQQVKDRRRRRPQRPAELLHPIGRQHP